MTCIYPIIDIAFYPIVLQFFKQTLIWCIIKCLWRSKISNQQKDCNPVLGWSSSTLLNNCVSHEWLGLNPYCLSVRTRWVIWDIIGVTNSSLCYPTTRVGQVLLFWRCSSWVWGCALLSCYALDSITFWARHFAVNHVSQLCSNCIHRKPHFTKSINVTTRQPYGWSAEQAWLSNDHVMKLA